MADEASGPSAYRIKVKIGVNEFEATGPQDLVREQYDQFLKAVNASPEPRTRQTDPLPPLSSQTANAVTAGNVSPELVNRMFMVRNDLISLRSLPTSESADADTLLLLLWGYLIMNNSQDVSALTLINAARQSGLQVNRLDRIVASLRQYVGRGGSKKGTRYSLNNAGIARAQQLAHSFFE